MLSLGSLLGLRMGMIVAFFQIAGIVAVLMELLNMLHRYLMPAGPRCLRWSVVKLSGPIAV